MIKKKTTLILGAGASHVYGYPTGIEFRDLIYNRLAGDNSVLRNVGISENEIQNFRESLYRCGKISVDAFLEHRPDLIKTGKLAMAHCLIPLEKEDILFRSPFNWYQHLYDRGLNASFDTFGDNQLSIITFNYDRSFEHFLFNALKHSYPDKTDKACADKIKSIPLIHLYGQLDFLPWQSDSGRAYKTESTPAQLIHAAERIKIIHEKADVVGDPDFELAKRILTSTEKIIFLGFGYNPTNLSRLGVEIMIKKNLKGTAFGLRPLERTNIKNLLFAGKINLDETHLEPLDVYEYIRHEVTFE